MDSLSLKGVHHHAGSPLTARQCVRPLRACDLALCAAVDWTESRKNICARTAADGCESVGFLELRRSIRKKILQLVSPACTLFPLVGGVTSVPASAKSQRWSTSPALLRR